MNRKHTRKTVVFLNTLIIMMLTVLARCDIISTNHANPAWEEVIKENVKLVNRTTQTMLLRELVRKKIPLKDVISIEAKLRWNGRGKKAVELMQFLMKRKLKSALTEERRQRRRYMEAKKRLFSGEDRVGQRSKVAFDFRALQRSEVRKLYTGNLDRNRKKIDHLIEIKNRQRDNAEKIATMFGVKVGDKELGEHEDKPANVWGKAEVGEEAKEVLNLGKKFRIHQRLDSIAKRTEIEKGLTIVRWKEKEMDDEGGTKAEEDVVEKEELGNVQQKIVDLTLKKATDMKFNRRIFAPNAAPIKLKSNLQQTKEALEEVFETYKKEKADSKGNIHNTNLTTNQSKGLTELKKKMKEDLVVMPTDKTMGLSVETKESYKAAAEIHIKEDEKVKEKERKHTEAEFNSMGKAVIRFLAVGGGRKQDDRIKEAMLTENVMLPPLSLYGKDHKPNLDIEKGPVRRPVVGASEGPNARVSDLAAEVLNRAADAEDSKFECPSTEALQAKIEELNKRLIKEAFEEGPEVENMKVVAGSLDFKAWYPSLKKEVVVPTLRKRLEDGPATFKVNEIELARFLFVMMEDEAIKKEGLEDVLHTLQDPAGRKPRLTDQEMVGGDDFRTGPKTKLNPPKCKPTEVLTRRMVAIGLSLIVEKVMSNFLYTFGGEDRRQASGGPIGDVLTQAIARHMGNEFDEKCNLKMNSLNIKTELYQRYADDIDLVVRSIGRKRKFCPEAGNFVEKTSLEVHEESSKCEDEITMNELKKIADNIIKHVETEHDCPSFHPELGYKVPVLDLAVWVEEVRVAAPGLEVQKLQSSCSEDEICLPVGELPPQPPVQPSNFPSYTTPVHRGCVSGRSIDNSTSDFQLIQPPGSQEQFSKSDGQSAPHPIPSCYSAVRLRPTRPCRSNIGQSQPGLLATRDIQLNSQGVGLHPPDTIDHTTAQQHNHQHYATPAHQGCATGRSIQNCSSDTHLIQPPVVPQKRSAG